MAANPELAALAREMAALESETFEIVDYAGDAGATLMDSCTSTTSCSTTSSTCSTTSTCG